MLGYGFLNSKVQELCLKAIMDNYFRRNQFIMPFFYAAAFVDSSNIQGKKITKDSQEFQEFFSFFLIEESYLSKNDETKTKNILYSQDDVIKYILSSNIIKNKDYNYDAKTLEEIKKEGLKNLNDIFYEAFQRFIKNQGKNIFDFTMTNLSELNKTFDQKVKSAKAKKTGTSNIINYGYSGYNFISLDLNDPNHLATPGPLSLLSPLIMLNTLSELQKKPYRTRLSMTAAWYEILDFYKKNNLLISRENFLKILDSQIYVLE